MEFAPVLAAAAGLAAAVFTGTLVEYVVHRLMHGRKLLAKKHAEHHRHGWGQGVLGEFRDYLTGSLVVMAVGSSASYFLLHSLAGAVGFATGGVLYAFLAAYAHQVQHERPELVFWLRRPVHHLHHHHHLWHYNFGILVDFWDRVFGTYKALDWAPARPTVSRSLRSYFQIKWF